MIPDPPTPCRGFDGPSTTTDAVHHLDDVLDGLIRTRRAIAALPEAAS